MSNSFFDLATRKITRPLDMGEYADEFAGQTVQVIVTAPRVIEELERGNESRARLLPATRAALVHLLEGATPEIVAQMDDELVMWLFDKAYALYVEYHASLKKKSADNSTVGAIPSTAELPA